MITINLFPTPIYCNHIKLKKEYKDILISENYKRFEINNGYVTTNKYVLNNEKLSSLKKEIFNNLNEYLFNKLKVKKNTKFKMLNSWCIKHSTNDWSQAHYHENSFISGILYLKNYEDSGDLVFHKEGIPNIFSNCIKIEFDEFIIDNSETFFIKPKDGDLILFPSHLKHSVTKNLNKNDRYCCAFNFFPNGKFGNIDNSNFVEVI